MSYTPPAGNAANFTALGYYEPGRTTHAFRFPATTPAYEVPAGDGVSFELPWFVYPLGTAVDFVVPYTTPTVTFVGSSTFSLNARGLTEQAYAISSTSTTYFEHPYRDFTIATASSFAAVTDQRHVEISTSSTPLFRYGFRFTEAVGTTITPQVWATLQRDTSISTASTLEAAGTAFNLRQYAITGSRTSSDFRGGRNYDAALIARTDTTTAFRSAATKEAAFSGSGTTIFVPRRASVFTAIATSDGASTVAFASRYGLAAQVGVASGSVANFYGLQSVQALFGGVANTSAAFASSYTYSEVGVVPLDADVIYVKPEPQRVTVFA